MMDKLLALRGGKLLINLRDGTRNNNGRHEPELTMVVV